MDRLWSPFCAGRGDRVDHQAGRGNRDAELHRVAIGDEHMAGAVRWSGNREDEEAPTEEGVSGIRHLDLFGWGLRRVVERGIMKASRLTILTTRSCCQSSKKRSEITAS
jgi:hypothetical protein